MIMYVVPFKTSSNTRIVMIRKHDITIYSLWSGRLREAVVGCTVVTEEALNKYILDRMLYWVLMEDV